MAEGSEALGLTHSSGQEFPELKNDASIGVVVPGYGHPRLLAEAVVSACEQQCSNPVYAVIVDDGCKYPETAETAQALIQQYPGKLFYLRQPNTRLPGARNAGIRFLLQNFEDLGAIFFLDADNRLQPHSLRSYYRTLTDNLDAAWAYPDINFFGMTWGTEGFDTRITARKYSVLKHLVGNISEAGSLVRAEVFREGHLYDETMRDGFEDWEFWLQLLSAGFKGVRAENAGFFYRRRSESMLTDSRRVEENIISGMRRKHAALYSVRNVMQLEHLEAPAFAVILVDNDRVLKFSDPFAGIQETTASDFKAEIQTWMRNPHEDFFPIKTLVTTEANWLALNKTPHWLRWFLWKSRGLNAPFVGFCFEKSEAIFFRKTEKPEGLKSLAVFSQSAIQKMYHGEIHDIQEVVENFLLALPDTDMLNDLSFDQALEAIEVKVSVEEPMQHLSQRFAGPSAIEVRRTLSEEMTAEEGRQPFGVCHSGKRFMVGIGQASFASNTPSKIDELVEGISHKFGTAWESVLAFENEPATFNGSPAATFRDLVPLEITRSDTETRNFMGRTFSNLLTPDAREDGSLTVRTCSWLIALGACGIVEVMGEARSHSARTSVILLGSSISHDDLTRILAYEHAISDLVCDNEQMKALLSGSGVPPGKIMSFSAFQTAIANTH